MVRTAGARAGRRRPSPGFRYWQAQTHRRSGAGRERIQRGDHARCRPASATQAGELAEGTAREASRARRMRIRPTSRSRKLAVARRDYDDAAKVLRSVIDDARRSAAAPGRADAPRTRADRAGQARRRDRAAAARGRRRVPGALSRHTRRRLCRQGRCRDGAHASTRRRSRTDSAASGLDSAYVALKRDASAAAQRAEHCVGCAAGGPPAETPSTSAQDKQP